MRFFKESAPMLPTSGGDTIYIYIYISVFLIFIYINIHDPKP